MKTTLVNEDLKAAILKGIDNMADMWEAMYAAEALDKRSSTQVHLATLARGATTRLRDRIAAMPAVQRELAEEIRMMSVSLSLCADGAVMQANKHENHKDG